MKKYIVVFLAAAALWSCSSDKPYTKLESGLSYKIIDDKEGEPVKSGESMMLSIKTIYKDSVIAEPQPRGGFFLNPETSAPPMLRDVLTLLSEGDSASIKFNHKQYTQLVGVPLTQLDTAEAFYMEVRVQEINDEKVFIDRIQAEAAKESALQLEKDKGIIETYLSENGIQAESTADGIYYVIKEKGQGEKPKTGQKVSVDYEVRMLDGTLLDTSYEDIAQANNAYNPQRKYVPYEFVLGTGSVIKGWDLGVPLVNKGGSATLFIPSALAYGLNGRPGIPPNTILLFELKLVDVK